MANEWIKVELYGANDGGNIVRYECADSLSVSKGMLLKLVDSREVSYGQMASAVIAGVASEEHPPGVGSLSIGCWTDGIFEVSSSGSIIAGAYVVADLSTNYVKQFPGLCISAAIISSEFAASMATILGRALEEGTGPEVINVRLKL